MSTQHTLDILLPELLADVIPGINGPVIDVVFPVVASMYCCWILDPSLFSFEDWIMSSTDSGFPIFARVAESRPMDARVPSAPTIPEIAPNTMA